MATQDDYIRTALRVPPELHGKIHESAKSNNRTFNAEIVDRLQASFEAAPAFKTTLAQQREQLLQLQERRNTLVLLLGAVDASTAPSEEITMLQRRLAEIELSIANTEKRIKQFSGE